MTGAAESEGAPSREGRATLLIRSGARISAADFSKAPGAPGGVSSAPFVPPASSVVNDPREAKEEEACEPRCIEQFESRPSGAPGGVSSTPFLPPASSVVNDAREVKAEEACEPNSIEQVELFTEHTEAPRRVGGRKEGSRISTRVLLCPMRGSFASASPNAAEARGGGPATLPSAHRCIMPCDADDSATNSSERHTPMLTDLACRTERRSPLAELKESAGSLVSGNSPLDWRTRLRGLLRGVSPGASDAMQSRHRDSIIIRFVGDAFFST